MDWRQGAGPLGDVVPPLAWFVGALVLVVLLSAAPKIGGAIVLVLAVYLATQLVKQQQGGR